MALTPDDIAMYKGIFLAMVPENGTAIGNKTLRPQLRDKIKADHGVELTDDDYWAIRNALLTDGKLRTGKGNGGSVARTAGVVTVAKQPTEQRKYKDEADLYPPVHDTIKSSWVKNYEIDDFVSQVTANQGGRNTGGKWTRPDITLVALRMYPFIPGKSLEVITFEIKPWYSLGVEGVFETASHSAFANRSYLMIHAPSTVEESDAYERIEREADRFRIGLVTFDDPADWDTYNIRIDAEHNVPDPSAMCRFISEQLTKENQGKIQRMIR